MVDISQTRRMIFLEELREHGIVARAARAASPNLRAPTSNFKRLRQKDPDFALEWDDAIEEAKAAIEHEIHRRATIGYEEDVYYRGEVVGTVTKYSDALIQFRAKALLPQYRDQSKIDHNVTGAIAHVDVHRLSEMSKESRDALRNIIRRETPPQLETGADADGGGEGPSIRVVSGTSVASHPEDASTGSPTDVRKHGDD
jgi:hypothetical protein